MELSDSVIEIKLSKKLVALVLTLIAVLQYVALFNSVPGFIETYTGFSADLGYAINILFTVYPVFLALALFSCMPFILLIVDKKIPAKYHQPVWRSVIANFIVSIAVQGIVSVILKGPIFSMVSVI